MLKTVFNNLFFKKNSLNKGKLQEANFFSFLKKLPPVAFFFAFPVLMLFIIELINKRNFIYTLFWPFGSPVECFINYIIILCIFCIFTALLGKMNWSASISFAFVAVLSLISSYKETMLGEPLFPWDIYMANLVINLLPYLYKSLNILNLLFVLISFGVVLVIALYVKKNTMPIRIRIVSGILSIFLLSSFSINPYMSYIFLPKIGVSNMDWVQMENYDKNGFVLAFIMNIKNILIKKPENYNKNTLLTSIETISAAQTVSKNSSIPSSEKPIKPNVIMIMSESFWNPTLIKNISFSSDPIPTFRKLSSEYSSGNILSPSFGGGTSNVEFEILTGNSVSFLPDGSNPYQQYIYKPTPSLASIFSQNGYESIAIHSYFKWFFNRDIVYNLLGFKKFIGIDDFVNPTKKGFYISDKDFSKKIISEYKKAKNPVFIYAISMQNHGPYDPKRYTEPFDITVSTKNLSEKSLSILQDYTQGLYDADKSLKEVVNYFSKVKEPTIVVFFGDHLPLLGNDFSVYRESGYVSSDKTHWTNEEYKKMYSPPVVVWTNYKHARQDIQTLGASYLGEYLLDFIGIPNPPYFEFLKQLRKALPGETKYLKIASDNTLYNGTNLPEKLKSLENTYWLLEYDLLFGKGYLKDILFNAKTPNK